MFNNLETGGNLSTVTEEELEAAMGPAESSKKKSSVKPADNEGKDDKNKIKKTTKAEVKPTTKKAEITTLSSKDAAAAFAEDETENEDDEEKENEDEEEVEGTVTSDEDEGENDNDEEIDDDNDDDNDEEKENEGNEDDASFLKARAEYLIKKGEWKDWEGRDKEEWTEDKWGEMELQQQQQKKEEMREELLSSFGPYGKKIAEFSENGGDPDELIDIFKEEQRVQSLSVETEDSQRDVVFLYETQFLNKKPERVRKYIDGLVADKELAVEAKEAKEKMEEYWANERESLIENQAEAAKEQKLRQKQNLEKFSGEVTKFVTASKDIPDAEKQVIIKALTKFDKKGPNGLPVNDFFFKFAEFKKDLPNYIDLVRFVIDPKKFSKQLKNEGKTESVEKGFALIRQNNKGKKTRSSGSNNSGRSSKKSNFRLMY